MPTTIIGLTLIASLALAGDGPDHRAVDGRSELVLPEARPSTVSVGHPFTGRLRDGIMLPARGPFHSVQYSTNRRKWLYGTAYLVRGVLTASEEIEEEVPGGEPLVIGNLSRRGGGDITMSMSHNSGRDVDFAYYMADLDGRSVPSKYHRFREDGRSSNAPGRFKLDIPRNWAAVKTFLLNTEFEVQWVIVAPYIERLLLEYATEIGEPDELVFRAERVMMLPGYAKAHDNHIHLRVLCSPEDWERGCKNGGPVWPWSSRMVGALDLARRALRDDLADGDAHVRLRALKQLRERAIDTAVIDVSPLLADIERPVRIAAEETMLALTTEATAATVLKIARWAAPGVAVSLIDKALPLAGSEGLRTAHELLEGTHPVLEANLGRGTRSDLERRARTLVERYKNLPTGRTHAAFR